MKKEYWIIFTGFKENKISFKSVQTIRVIKNLFNCNLAMAYNIVKDIEHFGIKRTSLKQCNKIKRDLENAGIIIEITEV